MAEKITAEQIKTAGLLLKREHEERLRLEKVAMEFDREKRAQKIAFRVVELGVQDPYKSHEDFQSKVASLLKEDLDVVEKALEYGTWGSRRGMELAEEKSVLRGGDPLTHFVLTDELVNT